MKRGIYSVRDEKVGFTNIFLDDEDEAAKRGFAYAISNTDGMMHFAPADFSLYRIGSFNSETGLVESLSPYVFIAGGGDFA